MYIWTGCKLPEDFESAIRRWCLPLAEELGLDVSGFTLPQHISLKISFEAGDRYPEVLDAIEALLRREAPFTVIPTDIDQYDGVLWISFQENETMRRLHDLLDSTLEQDYHIHQHFHDKHYFFHSTLLLGDPEKISQACSALQDFPLPPELKIGTFLQGVSETGKSGDYRVVREVKI